MHDPYDRSSKWLIQHHGDAILRLGGVQDVQAWRPLQADVVQPRQLPDGLLEVRFTGRPAPDLFLVEISTYPERRLLEQVVRDLILVMLDRRQVPEMLTVVLQPRGNFRVTGAHEVQSRLAWAQLRVNWRVVELWTLPAEQLLAANDIGLIPWVPLTHFDGPAEAVLQECRQRIDHQAPATEHENRLAVTQVLTRLRYNDPNLLALVGGRQAMIESPLIQELLAERMQKDILRFLAARFGPIPQEVATSLQAIQNETKLEDLADWAGRCTDLEAFRAKL
jgi:hypothetical protein